MGIGILGRGSARRRDRAVAVGGLLRGVLARLDQRGHERVDLFQGGRPRRGNGGRLEALVREVRRERVVVERRFQFTSTNRAQTRHLAAVGVVAHVALELVARRAHADLDDVNFPREPGVRVALCLDMCFSFRMRSTFS